MTDNEIIKALKLHQQIGVSSCDECPYKGKMCNIILTKDTLDLINRQKAEIERLQSMNQAKLDTIHDLMEKVETLNQPVLMADDIEINKEELLEKLQQSLIQILPGDDTLIRAKAIEEFWTKVRAYAVVMGCYHIVEYGDGVVKEMVGEQNG